MVAGLLSRRAAIALLVAAGVAVCEARVYHRSFRNGYPAGSVTRAAGVSTGTGVDGFGTGNAAASERTGTAATKRSFPGRLLQRRIDDCARMGGGRVVVPRAEWVLTAPLVLRSNVELRLSEGTVLAFAGTALRNPLVRAVCCTNVAVVGAGTFAVQDDRGSGRRSGDKKRPWFFLFDRCRNVRLEGVTIREFPMGPVRIVRCEGVKMRGVDVKSSSPNDDGVDVEESPDVSVEECSFELGRGGSN